MLESDSLSLRRQMALQEMGAALLPGKAVRDRDGGWGPEGRGWAVKPSVGRFLDPVIRTRAHHLVAMNEQ